MKDNPSYLSICCSDDIRFDSRVSGNTEKESDFVGQLSIISYKIFTITFMTSLEGTTNHEPTDTSKQPIRTRYLGHVTSYRPIRDQYFLIRSVPVKYTILSVHR